MGHQLQQRLLGDLRRRPLAFKTFSLLGHFWIRDGDFVRGFGPKGVGEDVKEELLGRFLSGNGGRSGGFVYEALP